MGVYLILAFSFAMHALWGSSVSVVGGGGVRGCVAITATKCTNVRKQQQKKHVTH